MQTKKILGIALVASLVASMSAVSATTAFARENIPADENYDVTAHNFSVIGAITGDDTWQTDVAVTDEDGDGIYEAVFEDVAAGTYEFKVRADADWEDSWGDYEEDFDRTFNSQTNCKITLEDTSDVWVKFDTTGENPNLWEVSYGTPAEPYEIPYEVLSVIGAITGDDTWQTDIDMNDEDGDGIYEATIEDVQPGTYEFKVRADHEWGNDDDKKSWGAYEEDFERTRDSQTNLSLTLEAASDVTVSIDVKGDIEIWPVSYTYTDADGEVKTIYTGAPKADDPAEPVTPENPTEDPSTEDPKTEEPSTEDPKTDEPAKTEPEYYVTKAEDYIFFDNTDTKWDKVYAYWWGTNDDGYTNVVDLFNNDYNNQADYPGTAMTEVVDENGNGTGIWKILKPFNADTVIFSNGHSDADVIAEWRANKETGNFTFTAYQTADILYTDGDAVDGKLAGGYIYKISATAEPTVNGSAANSLKYTYAEGDGTISKYEGEFNPEQFGTKPEENHDVPAANNGDSTTNSGDGNTTNNGGSSSTVSPSNSGSSNNSSNNDSNNSGSSDTGTVSTGDVATGVTFAAVAAAALGAVVLAAKKKSAEE